MLNLHRGRSKRLPVGLMIVCWAAVFAVVASCYSEDNTYVVIDNHELNIAGTYYVGQSGSRNRLLIRNAGRLNDVEGILGSWPGANNNTAMVIGVSSVWSNATNLIVGQRGIGNRLSVSNGALVQSANGYVGYQTNNNAVYLTGVGSLWRNSANLYIGCFGGSFGNRLTILDGARVESSSGCIGLGREAVGFTPRYYSWGNEVVVSGAGSVWSNQNDLHVGDVGTNNLLRIWTGALVSAKSVKVGRAGGDNVVMLSDGTLAADSVIVCPAALNWLGGKGAIYGRVVNFAFADANVSGGTLTFHGMVCNRGSLRAYSGAVMEFQNAVFNLGTANFSGGGAVFHGPYYIPSNPTNTWASSGNGLWREAVRWAIPLAPSDSFSCYFITNATTKTVTVDSLTPLLSPISLTNLAVVISAPAGNTNTLLVQDLSANATFFVGQLSIGAGGKLVVSNASVSVGLTTVEDLTVDGELIVNGGTLNSEWAVLKVSTSGIASVTVLDGELVVQSNDFRGLTVICVGSNGVWRQSSGMNFGRDTPSNQLIVTDGGQLQNASACVGLTNSHNNVVLVRGTNSVWNNSGTLTIGSFGSGNQLTVSNGALVSCSVGSIGQFSISSNNVVLVADRGSVWAKPSSLAVGERGSGNCLIISNGGLVQSFNGTIGSYPSSGNNLAFITGNGSVWSNDYVLYVGSWGYSNRLCILDGASVLAGSVEVGRHGMGNTICLSNGTLVTPSLVISNGNTANGFGWIEGGIKNWGTFCADGGTLSVSGSVTNYGWLRATNGGVAEFFGPVFDFGRKDFADGSAIFHSLYLSSGGDTNVWIGIVDGLWRQAESWSLGVCPTNTHSYLIISNANTKTVRVDPATPQAAPWSLTNWCTIVTAPSGATNTLLLETPAWAMANVFVGPGGRLAISNATLTLGVFGIGSLRVEGELAVHTGTLDVSVVPVMAGGDSTAAVNFADGVLLSQNCQIDSTTTGGVVVVSGSGLWQHQGQLCVGTNSSTTTLVITDNVQLATKECIIGGMPWSPYRDYNLVLISGSSVIWSNSSFLWVGHYGHKNCLRITEGATVFASNICIGIYGSGWQNAAEILGANLIVTNETRSGLLQIRDGSLTISNGSVFADCILANSDGSPLYFQSGTLCAGCMTNNNAFVLGMGGEPATLLLRQADHYFDKGLTVSPNATLTGAGAIWSYYGHYTNLGTTAVRPPYLALNKDFISDAPTSSLLVHITGPNTCGKIWCWGGGTTRLSGNLSVDLDGYTPRPSETLSVVIASSIVGSFAATNLPPLWPGTEWVLAYSPTAVVLSVTGRVQFVNYDIFSSYYSLGSDSDLNDPNHNGIPNLMEYALGNDPTSRVYRSAITHGKSNGWFQIQFTRNTDATNICYFVEAANVLTGGGDWSCILSNLQNTGWLGPASFTESAPSNGVAVVTVSDIAPAATNRFLRLRVAKP